MPARITLSKKRGKAKRKISAKRKQAMKMLARSYSEEPDVLIPVIQELIPLGLQVVAKELQQEVARLVGGRYQRGRDNVRWGAQPGSVYLRDQKMPIMVPRVRNTRMDQEVNLDTYRKLQRPFHDDRQTILKLLNGISTHKYQQSAELAPEVFGLSASNLSRRFKNKTAGTLRKLQRRSLSEYDIVCIFVDAKRYAKEGLIIALGITLEGRKIILGIDQSHSEHSRVLGQFFDNLIERGLSFEKGVLFVVDGSKGIRRGIENRFGEYGFIQRCQWHKRENVIAYLSPSQQALCRRKMKEAYQKTSCKEAEDALERLRRELLGVNQSAANSLMEGLEETLTLHQLGLSPEVGKSLNTTNCIESVMSQLGQFTDKVDRWHNSEQILRWNAASLMEIEPRLRKIRGFRYLKLLRCKMQEKIKRRQNKQPSVKQNLVPIPL